MSSQIDFIVENGVLEWFYGMCDEVVIPDDVTVISDRVFEGLRNIKRIVIPMGVTTIGDKAFGGCCELESIVIPDSITEMGDEAFCDCHNLKTVTLSKNIKAIKKSSFYNCKSLESIIIPEGLRSIGEQAFYRCSSLKDIHIPESVEQVERGAFKGCRGLADDDGFVIINNILFDYSGNMTKINIPKGVTQISSDAFSVCQRALRAHMPKAVNNLRHAVPYSMNHRLDLLAGVNYIENRQEDERVEIVEVDIPEGVTLIDQRAFRDCGELLKINLPCSIKQIGEDAFEYCDKLYDIRFPKGIPHLEIPHDKNNLVNNSDFYVHLYLYGDESDNAELKKVCRKIISKVHMKWFEEAIRQESVKAVKRIVECGKRSNIGRLEGLIETAIEKGSVTIGAFLLEYKNNTYTQEELQRYREERIKNNLE